MAKDLDRLYAIYDKTNGYCHLCGKKLAFINHGKIGEKGCWEKDHSVPRAKGGTDHINNLYPACYRCNREKFTLRSRTFRRYNGFNAIPSLSRVNTSSENWLFPVAITVVAATLILTSKQF